MDSLTAKLAGLAAVICILAVGVGQQGRAAYAQAPTPDADTLRKQHEQAAGTAHRAELKPGDVLGPENWELAKDLLPPEILKHYQNGEYRNPIADWPEGIYPWEPAFLEATVRNGETLTVNEAGTIVDRRTGKQPPYVFGLPFPKIDPQDPNAGIKVLWNYVYNYYYLGSSQNIAALYWLSPHKLDRVAMEDVYFLYYDGQPERHRTPNPNNLSQQLLATATSPADLQGTASLTWRYRDSDKRDSNWVYVPVLRRVRAVSPANRSDGFLGSDMSQDDGPFFDGKPEDFRWKLVGEGETLRFVDPESLKGISYEKPLPGGAFRSIWPDRPRIGFQDPNWKGVSWAPIVSALAKRKVWIIEGVPKDPYYLYGKIQLHIDKETYQGAWNRKFDWKGELVNTYQVLAYLNKKLQHPEGNTEWVWASSHGYQCAENIKLNRATVAGDTPPGKEVPNDRHIRLDPSFFDVGTLQRFGK